MTANERFKRQERGTRWVAWVLAVVAHVVLLFFTPVFEVDFGSLDASGPRLIVTFQDWETPGCGTGCAPGYAPYDTIDAPPRLTNGGDLNRLLSRHYPRAMWRHREPSSATYLVLINPRGRVRESRLLEPSGDAAEEMLGYLTTRARFEVESSLAATARILVERP